MLYIPKFDDYLKIETDDEVKNFVAIRFSEYFQSKREGQNFSKVYIFLTTSEEVGKMFTIKYFW